MARIWHLGFLAIKKGFLTANKTGLNPLFTVPGTGLEPVRRLSSEGF